MDDKNRKKLEAAGFRVEENAYDWLGLTDAEREMVELRREVSRVVRHKREAAGLTQRQLADRLQSSQSRVAKIEAGAPGVSLDLSFAALFAVGGHLADLEIGRSAPAGRRKRTPA